MAWKIEVTPAAAKQIKKLGAADAKRVRDFLSNRVATRLDPRQIGKPLTGSKLGHLWRYRAGPYRILCELQDERLVVLVVDVDHRRQVYRQ